MRQNEKKRIIAELADKIDADGEAFLALYTDQEKGDYYAVGDMGLIRNGIYSLISNGMRQNASIESRSLARAVVGGFYDVLEDNIDPSELLEDCSDCKLANTCEDSRAVAYRRTRKKNDVNVN